MSKTVAKPEVSGGKKAAGIIGGLAFLVGFILSLVFGFVDPGNGTIVLALVILGILVAILNITAKEVTAVMIAAIALIVAGGANIFTPLDEIIAGFGDGLNGIVNYLAVFMVPAAVISAIRAVIALARPGD